VGTYHPNTVDYVPLNATYSLQRSTDSSTTDLTLALTAGLRGIGSDAATFENKRLVARSNFVHLNVDFDHDQRLPLGLVSAVRFSGQFSNQALVSGEQVAAGGLTSVRGYLQSEAIGDDGVVGSVELRSPSFAQHLGSLIDEWRVFAFADGAYVWVIDPAAEQRADFAIYSAGLGTRFQVWRHIHGDVAVAVPLIAGPATRPKRPNATFSLKTDF